MSSASRFYRAVLSSSLGTAISRVFGLARTIALGAFLGAGPVSDAWDIAWTLPNAFRRFVADEGLTGALVPAISRAEADEGHDRAREVANTTLAFLVALCSFIVAILVLFSEHAVLAFAYSFRNNPEQLALAAGLLKVTAPLVFLVSFVSFMEGLLNQRDHYFVPKMAPGLLALGMVIGVASGGALGTEPVWGLAFGTLVGGVLHAVVNLPVLWQKWGPIGLRFAFGDPRFRAVAKELSKVIAIGLLAQVNILALRQLLTSVGHGVTTQYSQANRVVDLAQGIIAVGIGSALLPALSKAAANHDQAAIGRELTRALRLAGFLLLPAAAVLVAFGLPVSAILLRVGAYTLSDVQATAGTVAIMTPFMLSIAGINLLKKVFFAYEWRNALLGVGGLGVATTIVLGIALKPAFGLLGIAGALSVSTVVQFALYGWLLRRWLGDDVKTDGLASGVGRMALAAVPTAAWFALIAPFGEWEYGPQSLVNWGVLLGGLVTGGLIYGGIAWMLGVEELTRVVGLVRRRLGR
ncbi:MAG: murein biosynthesis integral membrane protein MurJ [Proteobacteria bacterium]|nr:murein biosynthesis integral membrane protein MurJ [Pseudomonadota bacterium]